MHDRCRRDKKYRRVGIDRRWNLFTNFMADMFGSYSAHEKVHGRRDTTLDRVDNTKGYSKENCRWSTYELQNSNKKGTKYYTHRGITDTLCGWAKHLGVKHSTLQRRLKSRPMAEALSMYKDAAAPFLKGK